MGPSRFPRRLSLVRSVLPIREPGKADGWLFATRMNGFVRLAEGKQTDYPVATGQLGVSSIERIENSAEGVLIPGSRFEPDSWRYRGGTWDEVSFAPPYEPAPDAPDGQQRPRISAWYETNTLIGRDGSIFTISATGTSPGTRTTARWRRARPKSWGGRTRILDPDACFLTPDGQLWNIASRVSRQLADDQRETTEALKRFVGGQWAEAAHFPGLNGPGRKARFVFRWGLRPINDAGPPWIVLDAGNRPLLRLAYGADFQHPRLSRHPLGRARKALAIGDASPWTKSSLLLATDRGLRLLTVEGDTLAASPIDLGARTVSRICRDARGRLWLAGEGLAVVEAVGKTIYPLDDLPMLGRAGVDALAADPEHPDGVIAAIRGRGVVFVRVDVR